MVGDAILYSPKTCTVAHSTDEPRNVREMVKVYNKFKARVPGGAHSLAKDRGVWYDVGHLHHRLDHRCVPIILIKPPPACREGEPACEGRSIPAVNILLRDPARARPTTTTVPPAHPPHPPSLPTRHPLTMYGQNPSKTAPGPVHPVLVHTCGLDAFPMR